MNILNRLNRLNKVNIEIFLFGLIVMIFLTGLGLSVYLHEKYWMFKQSTMGIIPKSIYIVGLVCIGIIYATIIYHIFMTDVSSKKDIILRFLVLFASNVIFFAVLYFIIYLFNNQEYGKTDENIVIASTLQGRYIQMMYFSLLTFFTV